MRRRDFIMLLGGVAAAWPPTARAQQLAKTKRIAMVNLSTKVGNMTINGGRVYREFFEELNALGYVEGRNLLVERYSAEGRRDHIAELARDVVRARPDLIIAMAGFLAEEFKMATTTIPIVAVAADPVFRGLVPSLAHPGGNITGVSVDAGIQVWGKRLGLLSEVIPKLSNVRFLASQPNWERLEGKAIREAANQAGITLAGAVLGNVIDEAAYQRVFTSMKQDQVDGLVVSSENDHLTNQVVIVELAAKNRIPAIYPFKEFADVGGLMAYSVDLTWRVVADIVDKILRGANPGDIPFFQPTKFELVINLKTAKAIGVDVPSTLVLRADQVIE